MFLLTQMLRSLIHQGELTVIDPAGRMRSFGSGAPAVTIRLSDRSLSRKLFFGADLRLGEAYMDGTLTVENGDIYDLLDLCLRNMGRGNIIWLQEAHSRLRALTRRLAQNNRLGLAKRRVAHHYDLSDELYDLFLDPDRQYSCGYYSREGDGLEAAQEQKKRHIAAKLKLEPGMKVLDIGSGWGGLGLYLAQVAKCDVTGITLSEHQHEVSNRRAADQGLTDRVRFKLQDYRQETGTFDRIVSVGMFEHVGVGYYPAFFGKVKELLTPDGVTLLHTIGRTDGAGATNRWIAKYIFPGGYVPALSEITPPIEKTGLYITDVEVLRLHYAYTLKEWRRRFLANIDRVREIYDDRFCRMWEFYLAASEATFRHDRQVVFQIQLSHALESLPLTRDYMLERERATATHDRDQVAAE